MLSDKEKISLNRMKLFARSSDLSVVTAKDMNIVVTLVEKQSKEIEELTLDLEEMTKSNNHKKENWVHKNILNSYVSKSKIKAKIEEIDKEIEVKREIAKNPMDRVSGRLLTDNIVELEKTKKVLQSLLEKE